jgi:hypothetical protein
MMQSSHKFCNEIFLPFLRVRVVSFCFIYWKYKKSPKPFSYNLWKMSKILSSQIFRVKKVIVTIMV